MLANSLTPRCSRRVPGAVRSELQSRLGKEPGGSGLRFYGASVGAVRGTVRNAGRRYPGLSRDEVTALSSELWAVPVFERRLAAVVLLQTHVMLLTNSDLTRLEGFIREARVRDLVDPLAVDVVGPLVDGLDVLGRVRADSVLDRWVREPDAWLRRAALLSPLLALRAGAGDWDRFVRHAGAVLDEPAGTVLRRRRRRRSSDADDDAAVVREAVSRVLAEMAKKRPELQFTSVGDGPGWTSEAPVGARACPRSALGIARIALADGAAGPAGFSAGIRRQREPLGCP